MHISVSSRINDYDDSVYGENLRMIHDCFGTRAYAQ